MVKRFSDIPDSKYVILERNRADIALLEELIRDCIDAFYGSKKRLREEVIRFNSSVCLADILIENSFLLVDCADEVKKIEAELREKGYIFLYETCQLGVKFTFKLRENNKIMSDNNEMNESIGNIHL
ncbi:hypothetical protein [Anaerovibrio sp. JC8]|uniref:hypothetical protein n=1 Tax=Anaerovibrio sp. JC8 TaxID=1240085 RepID=UPI000A109E7E|nr:hypothetical protein [Anaerovibrio sp. JC8]